MTIETATRILTAPRLSDSPVTIEQAAKMFTKDALRALLRLPASYKLKRDMVYSVTSRWDSMLRCSW